MPGPVTLVVEGATDEAVMVPGPVYGKAGKGAIDRGLNGYNRAASFSHWVVVRDLDDDGECGPELLRSLLPNPAPFMRLQVAVRAIESWLIADGDSLGSFLSVSRARLSGSPETLTDPKRALVDVARRSRRRSIREAFGPAPGVSASVGPGYSAALIEFASRQWRPHVAASRSDSLARLRRYLRRVSEDR
jgi:hypothetical protein